MSRGGGRRQLAARGPGQAGASGRSGGGLGIPPAAGSVPAPVPAGPGSAGLGCRAGPESPARPVPPPFLQPPPPASGTDPPAFPRPAAGTSWHLRDPPRPPQGRDPPVPADHLPSRRRLTSQTRPSTPTSQIATPPPSSGSSCLNSPAGLSFPGPALQTGGPPPPLDRLAP